MSAAPNQWQLRAAHRLDCRDVCIDCQCQFGDIEEHGLDACDTAAATFGATLKAERDRREAELRFQERPNGGA